MFIAVLNVGALQSELLCNVFGACVLMCVNVLLNAWRILPWENGQEEVITELICFRIHFFKKALAKGTIMSMYEICMY